MKIHWHRVYVSAVTIILSFGPWLQARGEAVSREAPAIYAEKLAPLLTPLAEALRFAASPGELEGNGIILLSEEINYLDESGRRYIVIHQIDKALNEAGAREIAEDTHTFRKANQKIHLIMADTVLPDGKRQPVGTGAAILQTPQRQADYALYDDQGELRLIFPNIKAGSITETIVIIEEEQFRMAGEFTAILPFAFGWPAHRINRVVEAPSELADRLRLTTLGAGVPAVEKRTVASDRVRLQWKAEGVPGLPAERNRPPASQCGPALWLTSLRDWDQFAAWYASLLKSHDTLSPALKQQVAGWTASAANPQRTLEILMQKVAGEVRYVGLEFGSTDLQPHDCNEVWENQYGDCKDKANLLMAMLRDKGISAHLCLLNTRHTGRIEQKSPDYRQFDHAIVAVEWAPDQFTFCDPTIAYAKPGLLSPNDADRDVLLIRDGSGKWAHTPMQEAGTLHYDLDLKAGSDGGVEGWLTRETTGYYGAADATRYMRMSRDELLENGHEMARGFFPDAEVVDVTNTPKDKWDGTYRFKAYLIVHGARQEGKDSLNLAFPQSGSLFDDVGTQKQRKTPYYLWRDVVSVSARFRLPEGLAPANPPKPFSLASPALDVSAEWKTSTEECRAELALRLKQSLIPATQFETFYNSLFSLRAWLGNPLPLSDSGKPPAVAPERITLDDFPILSSGEAQLELVDKRYPSNGNTGQRREALQMVMQYFPADKTTLFHAGLQLALLDWRSKNAQAALDRIVASLHSYRKTVDAEDGAWGDYLQALVLTDLQRSTEALEIFERLGEDAEISKVQRAWADYQQARILQAKSAEKGIQVLRRGMAFETEARPAIFSLLAKLLIGQGRMAELKKEIAELLAKKPAFYGEMITRLASDAGTVLPAKQSAEHLELIQCLEEAGKANVLGESFSEALQIARKVGMARSSFDRARRRLQEEFATKPLPPLEAAAAKFKTSADFASASADAAKLEKPEVCLRYELELLTRFEPDEDFPLHLWKATANAEWKERQRGQPEPLLPLLFDLCEQMPLDSDVYADGKLLRAKLTARKGDLNGARKIHEELLQNSDLSAGFKVATHERLASNLEDLHEYEAALGVYREMEAELEFTSAKDALLRAVFLNLETGRTEEAWRVVGLLGKRPMEALKLASTSTQILELVALSKDKGAAERYWSGTAMWWPAWQALEGRLQIEPLGSTQIVPAIADLHKLGEEVGIAIRSKDRRALFHGLRMIAHAARWLPSAHNELAGFLIYMPGALPEYANEIRRFGLTLADAFAGEQPDSVRKNQLWGAAFAIDTQDLPKALKYLRAFAAMPPQEDDVAHGMARLWGILAQQNRAQTATATAALEKSIASPTLHIQRGFTITLLADLYRQAGRGADEEKLLKREMESPATKELPADLQMVTARYEQLTRAGGNTDKLTEVVERWLQKNKPAWFDFAEPKTLEDPRLTDLEEVLKTPQQLFTNAEVIKLSLLAAASPTLPFGTRSDALANALAELAERALTVDEAERIYTSVIDDEACAEGLRLRLLGQAIFTARHASSQKAFEELLARPLAARMNERAKSMIEMFRQGLAVDDSSPEAILAHCQELLRSELDSTSGSELYRFHQRLLQLGQLEIAEKIRGGLAAAKLGGGMNVTSAGLQLEYLKAQNQAKRWLPMGTALRDLVLARYPVQTIQRPAEYPTLNDRSRLEYLPEKVAEQIRLFQIATRNFDSGDFPFWRQFIRDIKWIKGDAKLSVEMIAAALQKAPDDAGRAMAVSALTTAVDEDNAEVWQELSKVVRPYRRVDESPMTFAEIRLREINQAVRAGEKIDLEASFAALRSPDGSMTAKRMKLTHYLTTGNMPLLRRTLEAIGPDELLSDRLLSLSLRAFELAGMKEELEVAKPAARKEIYRCVLQSWAEFQTYRVFEALDLAEVLQDSADLPASWMPSMIARTQSQYQKGTLQAHEAHLRKDWTTLLDVSSRLIEAYPTFYHFYWYKGEALFQLGQREQSISPLETYIRYSKNELDYLTAMKRLKSAKELDKAEAGGAK